MCDIGPVESSWNRVTQIGTRTHAFLTQKTKIMASSPITSWQIDGETVETATDFIFLGSKITADSNYSHEIQRHLLLGRKKQRHHFANKGPHCQSYDFSRSHVRMWELEQKESWVLNNGCFWIVVLEKTLESPLDCKELKPVNPKRNQPWIFIGKTITEAEAPLL